MRHDPALENQLKSADAACRQLQALTASDAKSSALLFCVRSLLVKLHLDQSLQAKLDKEACARLQGCSQALAEILGEAAPNWSSDAPVMPALSDAVLRLQRVETRAAEDLVRRLLDVEMQSLRDFEAAYVAASAAGTETSAQSEEIYSAKALGEYLSAQVFADPDLKVDAIEVISGGYSKLTLRARLRSAKAPRTVILRVDRVASQKFVGTRVVDEYPLLVALHDSGVRVPKPYAIESGGTVLGAPALVLDEVSGKTVGDLFNFPAPSRELGVQLARQLVLIHTMPASLASASAASENAWLAAMHQEIDGLHAGWKALDRSSAIVEAAFRCIDRNRHLANGRGTFIHGDFGLHNVLVDQGRITAVLDWEFARIANPAIDLGWFYNTAEHLVGWETFLTDYAEAGGIVPPREQLDFYILWGALRFAVICCQVDAGFNAGALTEIDYAVPGNRLLRMQMLRVAKALDAFGPR